MPTAAITGQTVFGSNNSGTTTQLDNNFLLCLNGLNNFNQYSNYLVDSGAANAYIVTAPAGTTLTLAAGLEIQFNAANANTGASTLNANGTGVKNILNPDGTALIAGQIPLNAVVCVIYDGTRFVLTSAIMPRSKLLTFTRDVSLAGSAQSVTGAGFKPRVVLFLANVNGTSAMSVGAYDGTNSYCVFDDSVDAAGSYAISTTKAAFLATAGGSSGQMVGTTLDADGFTVTWGKAGVAAGTATMFALAQG